LIVVFAAWTVVPTVAVLRGPAARAQAGTAALLLALVNETRLDEGLDPYGQSRLLAKAAQRHADDIAENGLANLDDLHQGSDGSDEQERVRESGYAAWNENDGQLVVAENVWLGRGSPEDALASFLEDEDHRDHLLSDAYREIGIGVATNPDGRSIYVLDFGARPNVLPIFINDGAARTENREVAIRLTNERVRPEGEGAGYIGEAIEIRISNEPSFEALPWQAWARLVSWLLPDTPGEHTVYVQFRDAAGRTAASADGIVLDTGTPGVPTASPLTVTLTPTKDAPLSPSPTSASLPTPEAPTSDASADPLASPTSPPAAETITQPAASPPGARATPFPTWTPLPSPQPTPTESNEAGEAVLAVPAIGDYRRPLITVGILQGVVLVLAVYWVLRRGKGV
jgi:uncharacterized protein YkwD